MFGSSVLSATRVERKPRTSPLRSLAIFAVVVIPASYFLFRMKDSSGYNPILLDALTATGFFGLGMFGDFCYFKLDRTGYLWSLKLWLLGSVAVFVLFVAAGFLPGK